MGRLGIAPDPDIGEFARRRLSELAQTHGLTKAARGGLAILLAMNAEDEHAPTSVRTAQVAVDVHLADALIALELTQVHQATAIADLGAGAGFPGIPLALALPDARVALVESAVRKCEYLERAVRATGTPNADVVHARAELWADGMRRNDLVTARALAPLGVLCEYAAPLLAVGGHMVAWKGSRDPTEEDRARYASERLGLRLVEVRPVRPFAASERRHLYLYLKVRTTPERFPRRPGMARKRPLAP